MLEFKDYNNSSKDFGNAIFESMFCNHVVCISLNHSNSLEYNSFVRHLFGKTNSEKILNEVLQNLHIFDCEKDIFEVLANTMLAYIRRKCEFKNNKNLMITFKRFYDINKPFCVADIFNAINSSFRCNYKLKYNGKYYNGFDITDNSIVLYETNFRYNFNMPVIQETNVYLKSIIIGEDNTMLKGFEINDFSETIDLF